jgi:hypothetical protein
MNKEARWIVLAVVVLLGIVAWADDFVTLQGEHTIYTVRCVDGAWTGLNCSGHLATGDRYRFRALRARSEVLFWMVGSAEASGKFTSCEVSDGRNWSCKASEDAARSITLSMVRGRAQHDRTGATRQFQAISKWKWWCLRVGLGTFRRASY